VKTATTTTTTGLTAARALAAMKLKRIWRWLQGDGSAEDTETPITKMEILRFIVFLFFFLWVVTLIGKSGLLMDGF
jgi:hypothetical protein